MDSTSSLLLERSGAVATLTLHRPRALNALNADTLRELRSTVATLAADPATRVILLTGSGERAFAAGADIRELLATDAGAGRELSILGQSVFSQLENCGKPTLACLNGVALGGGLELAMACTLRLAVEGAQFGLPEARLGLIPGFGGVYRLIRLVGRSAALRLMLTGETIPASEALRLGLVDEVVPAPELLPRAQALAAGIAQLAPLAIAGLLETVRRQAEQAGVTEAFSVEAEIFASLCASGDKQEGLSAFLEKRTPVWHGA